MMTRGRNGMPFYPNLERCGSGLTAAPQPMTLADEEDAIVERILDGLQPWELTDLTVKPVMLENIAWHFIELTVNEARAQRIAETRPLARAAKEMRERYDRRVRRELHDSAGLGETAAKKFLEMYDSDFTTLYFSINAEIKRAMPDAQCDTVRTYAVEALMVIRALGRIIAKNNKTLHDKVMLPPVRVAPELRGVEHLMEAYAGLTDDFDRDERNIALCEKILDININELRIDVGNPTKINEQ